ncbi:MAG: HEAT repeat domain-containing protein, partial [Planctomycetota bacterium]|nr:HEAT repeat domain-containing protein [Planctomycetota bacterium]
MKWFLVVVMMLLCVPIYATYEKWEKKEGLNSYEKRAVQNMKDYEAGVEEKVRRDALVELRSLDEKALKEIREELLQDLREVVKTALKTDNKWRVRVEAPATLVRLGAKDALDALLEVAREYKKKEVRSACVEAVAKLAERGGAESIKALG